MSVVERLNRPTMSERMSKLEQRADGHDLMASQVKEMYDAFDTAKKILGALNWLWVKVALGAFGAIGALAAILTVWDKFGQLLGRH